jgi:hypothetical protein
MLRSIRTHYGAIVVITVDIFSISLVHLDLTAGIPLVTAVCIVDIRVPPKTIRVSQGI